MRCTLKDLFGFPAVCERGCCVFWREYPGAQDELMGPGCVLDEFSLTGTVADRLTRWLLEYKYTADKARVAAASEAHSTRMMSHAAGHARGIVRDTRTGQNSPSCPGCRSVVT